MRTLCSFVVMSLLCFGVACGDDGRGGGGDGDGGSGTTFACLEECQIQFDLMCDPTAVTVEECAAECEDNRRMALAAGCSGELAVAESCVRNAPDRCDPVGCSDPSIAAALCVAEAGYTVSGSTCAETCSAQAGAGCPPPDCMTQCMDGLAEASAGGCDRFAQSVLDCIVSNGGACEEDLEENPCATPSILLFGCLNGV